MQDGRFAQPVVFCVLTSDGVISRREVRTLREGLQALNRGLEGYCLDAPEWHRAFHEVSRALLDPSPENTERARIALQELADFAGEGGLRTAGWRGWNAAGRLSLH